MAHFAVLLVAPYDFNNAALVFERLRFIGPVTDVLSELSRRSICPRRTT